jgi:hypothetical protein
VPSPPPPGDVPAQPLKRLRQDAQDAALEAQLAQNDGRSHRGEGGMHGEAATA